MLRIGVDEGGHNVSQARSAYKASNAISDDKSEPRGFLTLLGLAWSSSRGAHTVDERGDSRDITSHLLSDSNPYVYTAASIVTPPPIYDSSYYLAYERKQGSY